MIADALHALIEVTLASSAAICFVLLLRKPARRMFGAQTAYCLWLIVPAAALAVLLPAQSVQVAMVTLAPASTALPDIVAIPVAASRGFSTLWFAVWTSGALSTCVWLWGQQLAFLRGLGSLRMAADGTLRAEQASAPAVVGVWRPHLVLPSDFEQRYNADECALVLAHEHAHLHRNDAFANALAAIAQCLFWFNPLLHWALTRFRFDQELACDAQVLANAPHGRRTYAQAMLKTQLAVDAAWRLPVGCHWQPRHPLKERIAMLKEPLPGRARRILGATIISSLIFMGAYSAWAAQPTVKTASMDVEVLEVNMKLVPSNGTASTPRLLAKAGNPFSVKVGDDVNDVDSLKAEFTAHRGQDGLIDLVGEVTQYGKNLANFKFDDLQEGQPVTMSANGKDGVALGLEINIRHADPMATPAESKAVARHSNDQSVTFSATKIGQRAAALEVARLAGLHIENVELLNDARKVSFVFDRVPAQTCFDLIAEESNMTAVVSGGSVRFVPAELQSNLNVSAKKVVN